MESQKIYDMIILGAGPAGMTAGVYASRAGLSVLMMERGAPGGQMVNTFEIDNYTGFDTIGGPELSMKMFEHTQKLGVEYAYGNVTSVEDQGNLKTVHADSGSFTGKTVLVATGAVNKKLGVPGEEQLAGRGVSWCAICDGAFYKNKEVVVVGGGNSALEEAIYLAGLASKVTIIHRRQGFRADRVAIERTQKNEKISFELDAVVEQFNANNGKLSSITIKNVNTGEMKDIPTEGAFLYVGMDPVTDMVKGLVDLKDGYIPTNDDMETNVKGIYAIGDVRLKNLRQVVTAASDGAIAAQNAVKYIEALE